MQDKKVLEELINQPGEKCLWRKAYLENYALGKSSAGKSSAGEKLREK